MATFFQRLLTAIFYLFKHGRLLLITLVSLTLLSLAITKMYQGWDDESDRGAIAIQDGAFGESYPTPIYLEQGWSAADSLWFYNTTQGSALLPYDFFVVLEQENSQELLRSNNNMDKFRYLPQKQTFFNPDGFAVGFTRDSYQGKDYVGYTCAACHTNQVNYTNKEGLTTAIRIDGGPAMADMVGFLAALEKSMRATLDDTVKRQRFVDNVLALKNDYDESDEIIASLEEWTQTRRLYNTINHSHIKYG
ncbi:MAG: di-heme-cytochrome C peroxidase, partial [Gammaproteobacteria bacterium]|nr:di-heme-cytochrome C peroxidase [Gammaproteobacteria bacterium]